MDSPNAFSSLKSSGRICSASYIEVLQKKEKMSKFLSVNDFIVWYEKVPGKVKSDVESFLMDPINSIFIVEDFPGSLLLNPVTTFHWEKPVEGFFKLNTDGSYKRFIDGSFGGGCAAVLRDHLGDPVSHNGWVLPFASSSLEAEFIGVYLGLLQCKSLGFNKIIIESDCKEVVQVLNSSRAPQEAELDAYRHLFKVLASLEDCKILRQYRERNFFANELAVLAMHGTSTRFLGNFDEVIIHLEADRKDNTRFRINQDGKKLKVCKKNV